MRARMRRAAEAAACGDSAVESATMSTGGMTATTATATVAPCGDPHACPVRDPMQRWATLVPQLVLEVDEGGDVTASAPTIPGMEPNALALPVSVVEVAMAE